MVLCHGGRKIWAQHWGGQHFFSFFSLYVLCFCQPHLVPQKREKYNLFFKHKTKRMQEQTAVGTEMFITKHLFKLNELLAWKISVYRLHYVHKVNRYLANVRCAVRQIRHTGQECREDSSQHPVRIWFGNDASGFWSNKAFKNYK